LAELYLIAKCVFGPSPGQHPVIVIFNNQHILFQQGTAHCPIGCHSHTITVNRLALSFPSCPILDMCIQLT